MGTLCLKHYLARAVKLSESGGRNHWAQSLHFTSAKGLFPAMGITPKEYTIDKTRYRKEAKAFEQAAAMLRYYRDELGLLAKEQTIPDYYGKPLRLRVRSP